MADIDPQGPAKAGERCHIRARKGTPTWHGARAGLWSGWRLGSRLWLRLALAGSLLCLAACDRPEPTPQSPRTPRTRKRPLRTRAAAVTIRFSNSGVEPGSTRLGYDRLQISAVFADTDRRDSHLLPALVGTTLRGADVQGADSCVRSEGPLRGPHTVPRPRAWLQLLDVGNLALSAGDRRLPLRISLVPSLFSAVRGVRYDADVDYGRAWLASAELDVSATGGDGVAPFSARVAVPRPVRLTRIGGLPVRRGKVEGLPAGGNLDLRWGSVDGDADLQVLVGAEQGQGSDWLRCRLRDDGSAALPSVLLDTLPRRSPRQPWLVVLVRSTSGSIPGFPGRSLRLELVDSVRVL